MPEILPFQRKGAAFLASRRRALLADEQRVGKTPQAIAAVEHVGARSVLVLCPAIARYNWLREFMRWAGRSGAAISERGDEAHPALTVCSYNLLIQQPVYRQLARRWDVVINDESHFLKNEESKRTDAAYKIGVAALQCWNLTGTPMPNHAGELHPMLYAFGVTRLGYYDFINHYCEVDETTGKVLGNRPERVHKLRTLTSSIMLRRTLDEVAPEMPKTRWERVVVPPGTVDTALLKAASVECELPASTPMGMRSQFTKDTATLERKLAEAQGEIDKLDPRDSLWFRRYCALQKIEPVIELLREDFAAGLPRIVVFGWHVDALRAVAAALGGAVIDGAVPAAQRQQILDDFQRGALRLVCAQIVAAGTAIDLSAADEMLFLEQSWVPADNAQAAMRIVSQFKTRPTRARVVAVAGSIDEAVQRSLTRKLRMVNQILT